MSQQTTNRSFDNLARALAEGSISRRRALRLFAGTAIAALIPSRALADDDDDCVRICHVPRTSTGECDYANAQTRCVSRRERRRHLENHPCDCRGRCANCLATCQPNGGTCMANDDCCSGRCASGACADPCPSGRVLLSNGTCALPCTGTIPGECPADCGSFGGSCAEAEAGGLFCRGDVVGLCAPDGGCPTGSFCRGGGCVEAC